MKLAIMQPYFFPYIGYWQLINAVDKFVIYDDVNYINRGWVNRNRILYKGTDRYINVFLKGASQNKLINEIEVNLDDKSNHNNIKLLEEAYKNAPMYNEVKTLMEGCIDQQESNLGRYLEKIIRSVCEYLEIDTEILLSSEIHKDNSLRAQNKIIEINKILGASEYINAIGGTSLYNGEDFASEGIKLSFLQTENITYKQFSDEFHPNLSIIDIMMFNSKDVIKEFLQAYRLVEG
jgi:hypothetical protein